MDSNYKQPGSLALKLKRSSLSSVAQLLTLEVKKKERKLGFLCLSGQKGLFSAVGPWPSSGSNRDTYRCTRDLHIG